MGGRRERGARMLVEGWKESIRVSGFGKKFRRGWGRRGRLTGPRVGAKKIVLWCFEGEHDVEGWSRDGD